MRSLLLRSAGPSNGARIDGAAAPRLPLLRAARASYPAGRSGWLAHRAKFVLRALCRPNLTRLWLDCITAPGLQPLWALRPRIVSKLERPYVHAAWTPRRRLEALTTHYRALGGLLDAPSRAAIYGDGLGLLTLESGPEARRLELRLRYDDQFEKEGELMLSLVELAGGLTLATMTFCLTEERGRWVIWIGGLQGPADARGRGLIHDVAKEMHGLRPKAFVLWAVRQLAAAWSAAGIRAVSDATHIYSGPGRHRDFAASYDTFWAESDGIARPDGWEIPVAAPRRSREELKPSRRRAHELRYALLDDLAARLASTLDALCPGGLPRGVIEPRPAPARAPGGAPARPDAARPPAHASVPPFADDPAALGAGAGAAEGGSSVLSGAFQPTAWGH